MLIRYILSFALLTLLISCNEGKNKQLIIGEWSATSWNVGGAPGDYDVATTSFTFGDDGNYTFSYGGNDEKGKYFITNSQLYTTPEGGMKMMVKVPLLTEDSMIMDMNRGGQSEELTLVRKK